MAEKLQGVALLEYVILFSRRVAETRTLEPLLIFIIDETMQLVGAEQGFIVLLGQDGRLDYRVKRRQDGTDIEDPTDEISHSILDEVVKTSRPLVVNNAMQDKRFAQAKSVINNRLRSVMCVPLITQDKLIGAIYAENRLARGHFQEGDVMSLALLANQAAMAVENARLYDQLHQEINAHEQTETSLRESEARFRTLFNLSPDAMLLLDPHAPDVSWPIVDCNEAFCHMNGFTREALIGQSIDIVHPPEIDTMNRSDFLAQVRQGVIKKEMIHQRGDGSLFAVAFSSCLINLQGKELILGVDRDVSAQKAAEAALTQGHAELEERVIARTIALERANVGLEAALAELKEAQEKLIRQEKLAFLGQLAGSVGHELRNPLSVITNAVYFLQMSLADADGLTKEYLEMIDGRAREAEKIVTDLLSLSHTRAVERRKTAVSALVAEVLQRHPPPDNVTLEINLPPTLPPIMVDAAQIQQVLQNLVTNAYQAMREGGQLTIRAWAEEEDIVVTISDTGMGMLPEVQAQIFEPLFTTKTKGVGLGLSVSKNLVEVNNGRIQVQSNEGEGAVFTLILPKAEDNF